MALFVKKPQFAESSQFYTLGLNKTLLIVGLGNTGKAYQDTRHNIGFECIDYFANLNEFPGWVVKKDLKTSLTSHTLSDTRVILIKPSTMMNLSGEAVLATINFYKIAPEHLVVVHDEIDIPFGQIRTRIGGTSAGHNGIKSIIHSIGAEFGRVRIGIQSEKAQPIETTDFVLQQFSQQEKTDIPQLTKEVSSILSEWVYSGSGLRQETRSFLV